MPLHHCSLKALYVCVGLREFAIALMSVFLPIFLLEMGFRLKAVILFFAVSRLAQAIGSLPSGWLAGKFGLRSTLFGSMAALLLFYLALFQLESFDWNLMMLGVLKGTSEALFWVGFHTSFASLSRGPNRGRLVGMGDVLRNVSFFGPLIGGLVAAAGGFRALFSLACSLLFVSCMAASKICHSVPKCFTAKNVLNRRGFNDALGFLGHGAEGAIGTVIWPMIIFYSILRSYTALGAVTSISLVFSLAFVFLSGVLADIDRRKTLRILSFLQAAIWAVRSLVKTPLQLFATDAVYGVSRASIRVPFNAFAYDKADQEALSYTVFREICINFGGCLVLSLISFLPTLDTAAYIGAGVSLLYWFA